jgi:hypothetical protein
VKSDQSPRLAIVKSGLASPYADQRGVKMGDTIAYSYRVTNVGDVTLRSIAVSDPTLGAVSCPSLPREGLGPNGVITCTPDNLHTVTRTGIDTGHVTDTATAAGTEMSGASTPPSDPSTFTIPTASPPSARVPPLPTVSIPGATSTVTPPSATVTTSAPVLASIDTDRGRWIPSGKKGSILSLPMELFGLTGLVGLAVLGCEIGSGNFGRRRRIRSSPRIAHIGGGLVVASIIAVVVSVGVVQYVNPAGPGVDRNLPIGAGADRLSPAVPVSTRPALVIPALGIDAPVQTTAAVGPLGSASLTIPMDIRDVGWWDGTVTDGSQRWANEAPAPGNPGVAIVAGHVDSAAAGPGALYRLDDLRVGQSIEVDNVDSTTTWRKVTAPPQTIPKSDLPASLFATRGIPRHALVTCGGPFDAATGHYEDNVIVWVVLTVRTQE